MPEPASLRNGQAAAEEQVDPEQKALLELEDLYSHVNSTLIPMITEYKDMVHGPAEGIREKKLKDGHAKLSELLLQCLLKTDGIVFSSDAVRAKRKETVKFIQSQLDLVDAIDADLKKSL